MKQIIKSYKMIAIVQAVTLFSSVTPVVATQLPITPVFPMSAEDFFYQGIVRYEQADYRGAIEDFTKAIQLNPDYADAYGYRSDTHLYLEEYQDAIADATKAIRLAPQNPSPYNARCYARARGLGNYQEAISDCNKAIDIEPNSPTSAAFYSSRCYVRAGLRDKKALEDCNQSLEIDPNYYYAYEDRGLARSILGDKKGAIEDFQRAAELFEEAGDAVSLQRVQKLIKELQS